MTATLAALPGPITLGAARCWMRGTQRREDAKKKQLCDSASSRPCVEYADIPGFCKSAKLEEIQKHGHVLTPGRYVGAADVEDDGEPFEEKMQRLTAELAECFAESNSLQAAISDNLTKLGFPVEQGGN